MPDSAASTRPCLSNAGTAIKLSRPPAQPGDTSPVTLGPTLTAADHRMETMATSSMIWPGGLPRGRGSGGGFRVRVLPRQHSRQRQSCRDRVTKQNPNAMRGGLKGSWRTRRRCPWLVPNQHGRLRAVRSTPPGRSRGTQTARSSRSPASGRVSPRGMPARFWHQALRAK